MCLVLIPAIEYCKTGLYGLDCVNCPEFVTNPVVVIGKYRLPVDQGRSIKVYLGFLLLVSGFWILALGQCKIQKELKSLNELAEGLMKKKKGAKREIQMATKDTQTSGNADGQVGINRFHPQFSSPPITYQRPSINATRKIHNNTRRRSVPHSTIFPQSAQL